ncbi:MAG: hypothetical protein RLY58_1941 [Pseudomonadota bacterium]|jgi:hypothetical protein
MTTSIQTLNTAEIDAVSGAGLSIDLSFCANLFAMLNLGHHCTTSTATVEANAHGSASIHLG